MARSGQAQSRNDGGAAVAQGGRRALSADAIVEAAIRIADAEGIEAVSIRRLAAEIEARPMSLYDHIQSKDELLRAMAEEVTGEAVVPEPLPEAWREAMSAIARRTYATLVRHPWLIAVTGRQPQLGPNAVAQAERLAEALGSLDLEQEELWSLAGTVNDYVLGHSLRAAVAAPGEAFEEVIPPAEMMRAPELAALPDWLRTRSSLERFEFGLQIVLDGIERRALR